MVLLLVLFCLVYCLPIVLWFEGFKFGCLGGVVVVVVVWFDCLCFICFR